MTNLREELGHNTSLFNQYIGWAMKIIRFDFGVSYQSNLPVVEEIFSRINGTLLLAGPSLAISTLAGIIISFMPLFITEVDGTNGVAIYLFFYHHCQITWLDYYWY
ncbi:hypothetical protein AAHB47_29610 [Bacillus wiedmannii]